MFNFIKIGNFRIALNKLDYYGLQRNCHPDDPQFSQQVLIIAITGREPMEILVAHDAKLEDFVDKD